MRAMLLHKTGPLAESPEPLALTDIPVPEPGAEEVLIRVSVCGVCHTELDEIEGRTPPAYFPIVLGHQIVGTVEHLGETVDQLKKGMRVGVAWIHSSCGECRFCTAGLENLCPEFRATGRDANGGYAEYTAVPAASAFPIPDSIPDEAAAPLLCAGAIGYRSLRLTDLGNGQRLGLTGFGASAHLVLKMAAALFPDTDVYVFARSERERQFARELGAVWAGDTTERSPQRLHAIIDTTPAWKPVVEAMRNLEPGGRLVINAIRKETPDKEYLLNLDYADHLWQEKEIKSVANICRSDVVEFLELAARAEIFPATEIYSLEDANKALHDIKKGNIKGAKVLRI